MAQAQKAGQGKNGKTKKGGVKLLPLLVLLLVLPFMMPTVLVMMGLLPTLIAMISDDDPEKSTAISIGAMNLAGVVPFIAELWQNNQTMGAAIAIVSQSRVWLIMLGSAAIGKLLMYIIPPMMVSLATAQAEFRLAKLKESLIQLKEIWGPEVATNTSLEHVRKQNGA